MNIYNIEKHNWVVFHKAYENYKADWNYVSNIQIDLSYGLEYIIILDADNYPLKNTNPIFSHIDTEMTQLVNYLMKDDE